MKKALLLVALAASLFVGDAQAANSATAQTALPIRVGGSGPVTPYVIVIDTADTDLTIITPSADKMACIVGALESETSATNLTFKVGTTAVAVPELAANQGILVPISNHAMICGGLGEALKTQASVAISKMLLYVIQASYLDFSK